MGTRQIGSARVASTRLALHRITNAAPDKGAMDCAGLRPARLYDSLAGELGRYVDLSTSDWCVDQPIFKRRLLSDC